MSYIAYMSYGEVAMPTSVRLAPELEGRLDEVVRKTGMSKSAYIRRAVEEAIEEFEEEAEILETVRLWREGKLETYSLDEVMEHLGMVD